MHMYVYIHIHIYIHMHIYTCIHTHTCIYIYMSMIHIRKSYMQIDIQTHLIVSTLQHVLYETSLTEHVST
jgi:hypothetical protein